MKHQVMAHQAAVRAFKAQASNGKDAVLKAFAAKHLPAIEKHLKKAQEISGKLTGGGGLRAPVAEPGPGIRFRTGERAECSAASPSGTPVVSPRL